MPLSRPPVRLPPLAEGLIGYGLEGAHHRPAGELAGEAPDGALAGERPLANPREPLGGLEASAVREDPREELHPGVLGVEPGERSTRVLAAAHDAAAEVDQDLGDVDLDRAPRSTPRRGRRLGQGVGTRFPDAYQLRRQDRPDRSRVDRVVGVAASALVDGAEVGARRAADAVEGLASDLVFEKVGAAVV